LIKNNKHFDQKQQTEALQVGSIVLAPGFSPFDPSKFDNYQYAKLPNVMTSLEFERILSASGPTMGHVTRQSKDARQWGM
jgi:heterodisulfide reductase subunit A